MKKLPLLMALLFFLAFQVQAQQSVSIGTPTPDPSAVLLLVGNGNQGLVIPSTTNPDGISKKAGMIVYSTTDSKVYYCDGNNWSPISGGAGGTDSQTLDIVGNVISISNGNSKNISSTGPTAGGQLLMWDGSKWTATTGAAPATKQVLQWNGSTWAPADLAGATFGNFTTTTAGLTITGGTGAVAGSGASINIQTASATLSGLLAATDFTTFTNKLNNNILTTSGDILYHDGTNANRLARGSNGMALLSTATGLQWASLPGGGDMLKSTYDANADGIVDVAASVNLGTQAAGTFLSAPSGAAGAPSFRAIVGADLPNFDISKLTTGILGVARGGTGTGTAPANGQLLIGNGTGYALAALTAGAGMTVTNSAGAITLASTGLANPLTTTGDIIYGVGATPTRLAGAAGFLRSTGAAAPAWAALAASDIPNLDASKITAGALAVANGGTGATTASAALSILGALGAATAAGGDLSGTFSNLQLVSGTIVNADISATAAIAGTKVAPAFGSQNISTTGTLSAGASTVTGLTIGTSVWPANATGSLTNNGTGTLTWSPALTNPMTSAGDMIYGGAGGAATRLATGAGFLKGGATPSYASINLAGTDVSGTLSIANGGTGATTAGAALTLLGALGAATAAGGDLSGTFSNLQLVAGTIVNADIANVDAGKITTGTLPPSRGGTGIAGVTLGGVAYGGATNFAFTAAGTAGQVLTSTGTTAPTWQAVPSPFSTLNTIPKGNGSGLVASNIFDDGTNVGIGTTTPSFPLDIKTSLGLSAYGLSHTDGNILMSTYVGSGGPVGGSIGTQSNHPFFIYTNNSGAKLTILPSGDVGIGNFAPTSKLEVSGNIVNSDISDGSFGLTGDLPGYPASTYPTLKAAGNYIYFSTAGIYSGYLGGTEPTLVLLNSSLSSTVSLNSNGPSYFTGGNVGIGTLSPVNKLSLVGGGLDVETTGSLHGIRMFQSATSNFWYEGTRVGDGFKYHGYNGSFKGTFSNVDGTYAPASDARLKKNIETLGSITEKLMKLRPTRYHMKDQNESAIKRIGFIAQEVLSLFPEFVEHDSQEDIYSLNYSSMIVIAIKAIQEQQSVINKQSTEIEMLKSEMALVKKALGLIK